MAGKLRSRTITMLSFHGTASVGCHGESAPGVQWAGGTSLWHFCTPLNLMVSRKEEENSWSREVVERGVKR